MRKRTNSLTLKILISVYGALYFLGFIAEMIFGDFKAITNELPLIEVYTIPLAFSIFLTGAVYSWINQKIGGIILLSWHLIVWFLSMFLWREAGMVLVLIFPMLIPSVLLIRNWYATNKSEYGTSLMQWKLVLRVLLYNYAAIYLIVVASEVVGKIFHVPLRGDINADTTWDYSAIETGILFFEMVLFTAACIGSLWNRRLAGILLIVWYILIAAACQQYFAIGNSGPWIVFSIPLVVQGVLYFVLHAKEQELSLA